MNIKHDSVMGKLFAGISGIKPVKIHRDPKLAQWLKDNIKNNNNGELKPAKGAAHGNQ